MTAQILAFPNLRTCFRCSHYLENYCQLFDQTIHSEALAAEDCNGFEVDR